MMIFAGCERFGWFMKLFLFFVSLVFRRFFKSGVLSLYKLATIIFNKSSFSFSPFFDYRLLKVTEKKDGRQGRFHSLTKIIKRKEVVF